MFAILQGICPAQGTPKCTESIQYCKRAHLDDPRIKPTACPADKSIRSPNICFARYKWRSPSQQSAHVCTESHTLLDYLVLGSWPFLKLPSKNNNGLLIWIHCMVRELGVPVCLPARRPQRKTNVNEHLPVCTPTPPTQYPVSTAPSNYPPHAV